MVSVSDEPDNPDQSSGPEQTFADLGLSPEVLKGLAAVGYETPSQIQALTIPPLLEGRHVVGLAQTGTGKTAAFALPILQRLAAGTPRAQRARPIRCLVLTPTRELAFQLAEQFRALGSEINLRDVVVIGGLGQRTQH